MIRINKESGWYDLVANGVATIIGFGASALVNGFCNNMINSNQEAGSIKRLSMNAGKLGLETIVLYDVSTTMREEIDNLVDGFNDLMGIIETYQREKENEEC